ncbi:MAG: 3-phenylpropionate/cinnamic acid dioxygenase subunit beta [Devosia sp.]|nr:3-phenylpropionate/cinnamic acid dioxygenase subunit beta [Devosia sp.]
MTIDVTDAMRLRFEAEEFLFREADLLSEAEYIRWLDLLADDIDYWVPTIQTVEARRNVVNVVAERDQLAYMSETKATLKMRVDRLGFGDAWAEIPPSRMVHYVSNVHVTAVEGDEMAVRSNIYIYRSRIETEEDKYYGKRHDRLRRVDGVWKLARRKVVLGQSVLTARSISTFF